MSINVQSSDNRPRADPVAVDPIVFLADTMSDRDRRHGRPDGYPDRSRALATPREQVAVGGRNRGGSTEVTEVAEITEVAEVTEVTGIEEK